MKKFTITLSIFLFAMTIMAQISVPNAFSYQAVVRNNTGEIVDNQAVKFKFSILQNSETDTAVYIETQNVTTNDFGLVNLVIGRGTPVLGMFDSGSWGLKRHFLKVELDVSGGSTFSHLGTMELMSVPYAFHAKTAETVVCIDALEAQIEELQLATGIKIKDYDGNVYRTVIIGNQAWMAENLKTTKYKDGSSISDITDNKEWNNLTNGAYCWYNNDVENKNTYGALYNWHAVNTGKLCPEGWHVPLDSEWILLIDYLTSGIHDGTDYYGFTPLPGGGRRDDGTFFDMGNYGYWWNATEVFPYSWEGPQFDSLDDSQYNELFGFSVRCLKN